MTLFTRNRSESIAFEAEKAVDEGRQLSESVILGILTEHQRRVPDYVSHRIKVEGWASHDTAPPMPLAYDPQTGAYLGTTWDARFAEHRAKYVVLPDNIVPTAADLRRLRVAQDGTVRWEP
jgi:hypothetical protein